jgi:hypothetical protein
MRNTGSAEGKAAQQRGDNFSARRHPSYSTGIVTNEQKIIGAGQTARPDKFQRKEIGTAGQQQFRLDDSSNAPIHQY